MNDNLNVRAPSVRCELSLEFRRISSKYVVTGSKNIKKKKSGITIEKPNARSPGQLTFASSVIITSRPLPPNITGSLDVASLSSSPPVSISSSVVMDDVEHSRLWGSWERAARLSNNTQTAVAVTGLKAALVIGEKCENILKTVLSTFHCHSDHL